MQCYKIVIEISFRAFKWNSTTKKLTDTTSYYIIRKNHSFFTIKDGSSLQGRRNWGEQGGGYCPAPILADQLTLSQQGGQIVPNILLLPLRILRPSYASGLSLLFLYVHYMYCMYRVPHCKVCIVNWLWQVEIRKLDFVWRYLYIPEVR